MTALHVNILTLAHVVMIFFFAFCAYLQLNDEVNVALWFSIYMSAALACIAKVKLSPQRSRIGNLIVAVACSLFLLGRLSHRMTFNGSTNYGRENCGLLVVIGWMLFSVVVTNGGGGGGGSSHHRTLKGDDGRDNRGHNNHSLVAYGALGVSLALSYAASRAVHHSMLEGP